MKDVEGTQSDADTEATAAIPAGEPDTGQDRDDVQVGDEAQDPDADEHRVVNNGEVSDPGNSGGFGTSGEVAGSADKPNG